MSDIRQRRFGCEGRWIGDVAGAVSPIILSMGDCQRLVAWQRAHAYAIAMHRAFAGMCEDLLRQGDEVAGLCFSLTRGFPPSSK
jgi:hypothetical protein